MPPDFPKRALIYTRISRDDTGEGVANQRQEEDCRKLADLRRWQVVGVEEDISISASSGRKRPAWLRVLERVERGEVDVVLAYHIDRLTRSMTDLQELLRLAEEKNIIIATVSGDIDLSTDTGRLIAEILTAVAGAEVRRKGARQKRANEQRAAQGIPWRTGFRAFGYTLDGEVVEREAALIREAAEDVLNGTPLRAIVRRWKELEISPARSRKNSDGWTHRSVRSILLNPRNAGIATYKGEVVGRGQWSAILTEETHVLLVATLTNPARTRGEDKALGNKPRNLLSGIALCGECGWKVEAGSSGGKKVYKCANPKGDHLTTSRLDADDMVRRSLAAAIDVTAPGTLTKPRDVALPAGLWAERERINGRLTRLATSWAEDVLTDEQFKAATRSLQSQLAEVEVQIEAGTTKPDDATLRWEEARKFLSLDLWAQRRVLADLTEIRLWPRNKKRNVPISQQVTVHVTDRNGNTWAVLDKRLGQHIDPSAAAYEVLADVLVREQPDAVTSLSKAAAWLVESGHTDKSVGGLPGKLSPLVTYERQGPGGAPGWIRKPQIRSL